MSALPKTEKTEHALCPHTLGRGVQAIRKTWPLDFSKNHLLLAEHIRTRGLRGRGWSAKPKGPPCRMCSLFTISNTRETSHKGDVPRIPF